MDKSTPFTHPPDNYYPNRDAEELSEARKRLETAELMLRNEQAKNAFLLKKITDISGLLCSPDVKHQDGHWLQFMPPDDLMRKMWRGLSDAFRKLDDPEINRDHTPECDLVNHYGAFEAECTCDHDEQETQ